MSDYFVFGDVDSRDYSDIHVFNKSVDNTPKRVYEVKNIAGRNGAFYVDQGRYEDVEHSYGVVALTKSAGSNFINALVSQVGYHRLSDSFNEDEFYLATLTDAVEAKVSKSTRDVNTFDITFTRKPQRFLKSGEIPRTIGGSVTNTQTESGSIVSIESDGGDAVTSLVAQITPIQAGSGDPSPTNVRAITGWTAANVNVAGKNLIGFKSLLDKWGSGYTDLGDGSYNVRTAGTGYREPFRFASEDIDVTLSGEITQLSGASGWRFQLLNSNDETVAELGSGSTALSGKGCKLRLNYVTSAAGANFKNIQVELGTAATSYEPYKGTTTTTALGRTVYGGTVDVVTGAYYGGTVGVLTVTHEAETFNGTESWGSEQTSGELTNYYLNLDNASKMTGRQGGLLDDELLCNWLAPSSSIATYSVYVGTTSKYLNCKCSSASDVTAFKSMLTATPLVVVYPLATPQTYQLTAQQVELLTGQNHVWADTGDITITWGDDPNKLVNPTLYNAHPLLSFTASGAGTININNDTISVTNQPIGDIVLANVVKLESGESVTWTDTSRYLTGDAIRINSIPAVQTTVVMDSYSYANHTNYISDNMDYLSTTSTSRGMLVTHSIPTPPQYVAGTAKSDTYSATVINKVKHKTTGDIVDCTINLTVAIAYDGANNITVTNTVTTSIGTASTTVTIDTVTVNSTKSSLTGTAYIDLDIGEAYSVDGGAVVSINDSVSLGASLPVLTAGVNTIGKTGSVANLEVIPRWWEL